MSHVLHRDSAQEAADGRRNDRKFFPTTVYEKEYTHARFKLETKCYQKCVKDGSELHLNQPYQI